MVNQTVKLLAFAVLLLIPSVVFALPGAHDPVTGGQGFTCNSCHIAGKTIGNRDETYTTNVCLTCHTSGNAKTKKQFTADDFANPFVATTVPQANPIQSSHKWFGSDTVPAAGAQAPSDPSGTGLNRTGYTGYVSCGRCHSVHGTSGAESLNAPYLRTVNDTDQMCRNCHAPRDTVSHTLGSHPINVSYTSANAKALKAAGTLLANPVTNATNATGQVKLVNSKILCSTCHGVHTTDSNSATFDAFTTGHTINTTLTKSNGSLLRVDPRGATANATNICTNCHANKFAHNGVNQNVQCNDCHSGHVEYDPKATGAETTPNVYLVRRYLDYTTAGRPSKRIIYNSTTTKNFYNAAGGGVCQSCHAVPASTHLNANNTVRTDHATCTDCHTHSNAATSGGSFGGGCTSCHGYPPIDLATTAKRTTAPLTVYGGNEATAPHSSHASGGTNYKYSCDQCHNGYSAVHNNGTFTDGVFYTKVAVAPAGVIAGSAATYAAATTTCTAVYCHSDGTSTTTLGSPKTIVWANGLSQTLTCASCHAAVPTTGAHTYHVTTIGTTKAYTCKTCHANSATSNTAVDVAGGKHVNAVKDVLFTDTTPKVSGSNCATVYCHSNGAGVYNAPTWAAGSATNGRCNTCHATAESTTVLATGTHAAHLTAAVAGNTNATSCAKCHTYTAEISAKHVDGTIDVPKDANQNPTSCATAACHGNITAPTWGNNTTNDNCTKCHGTGTATGVITAAANNRYLVAPSVPAATATPNDAGRVSTTNVKTGAHETHLRYLNKFSNYSTVDYRCQTCHTLPAAANTAHINSSSVPAFTGIATKGGAAASYNATNATCSNVYCHNPKAGLVLADAGTAMVPAWNDGTYVADNTKSVANCQKCHLVPGSTNFTKQSAHGTMTTDTAAANNCIGCHGHEGNDVGARGQRHMDGIFYFNGTCDSCHGYPPVASMTGLGVAGNFANAKLQSYTNGGGKHTIHLKASLVATEGFTPCLPCHPDSGAGFHHNVSSTVAQANVNVNTATGDANDILYRFDSSRARRYNATTRTCSNVSCHFQPTAAW